MDREFEKAFYEELSKKKLRVMVSVLSSVTRSVLVLIPTLLMRDIYNSLEIGMDTKHVLGIIMLTFVLPIIVSVSYSADIRASKYIFTIIKEIRAQAFSNIINLDLRKILSQNKSDLFNRIIVSLEELGNYYYYLINTTTWYIATSIVGVGIMLMINWKITVGLLVFSTAQIGCSLIIKKKIEKVKATENRLQIQGTDYVIRIVKHNAFLKTALLAEREMDFENTWERESWKATKEKMINSQIVALLSFLLTLMRTMYLFLAARYLFMSDSMMKGDFIALNSYIVWLTPVFEGLQECVEDMIVARENKNRVNEYLRDNMVEDVQSIVPVDFPQEIEVSSLSFAYEDAAESIFSNLSFQVRCGEPLFIVGDSGCGKSTLLNVMLGMEPVYDGKIYYNGYEMRQVEDYWIRRNVTMVGQDVDILPSTLRHNLLYSGTLATEEEIESVLYSLKLEHLLEMPGALDWDMKKCPRELSDGEKKRLAIARAILGKTRALFLDEPTAGLDNISKMAVMKFIEENVNGILVVVTHDRVFEKGAQVLWLDRYTGK